MTMKCASCTSDIDHCHGELVRHSDGLVECTEFECGDLDGVRHAVVIDCGTIDGGCVCGEPVTSELLLQAS
jgi:hypothetical protein